MIAIPVVNEKTGAKAIMLWITPATIEQLQAGRHCDLYSDAMSELLGVHVCVRYAEDNVAAAAAAQRLSPSLALSFRLTEIDAAQRSDG